MIRTMETLTYIVVFSSTSGEHSMAGIDGG